MTALQIFNNISSKPKSTNIIRPPETAKSPRGKPKNSSAKNIVQPKKPQHFCCGFGISFTRREWRNQQGRTYHAKAPCRTCLEHAYLPQCLTSVSPIAEGVGETAMPASRSAFILSSAEPEFPETIAPACPILLPFGAVRPAINRRHGLLAVVFQPRPQPFVRRRRRFRRS